MTTHKRPLRIAIVHDWLVRQWCERVVYELHELFLMRGFTLRTAATVAVDLDGKVVTGYLQHWPFSKLRKFLPVSLVVYRSRLLRL